MARTEKRTDLRTGERTGADGAIVAKKYRLERQIGEGGMGAVYKAKHLGTERTLALKFLKTELADDSAALERFEREAKAAGRIDHDNICEVYDYGIDNGAPYIVMPMLKGRPLDEVIAREAPLSFERASDIVAQALSALEAAHCSELVHRDLKPENIFLTTLGDRVDFVKILDFGISKALLTPGETGEKKPLTTEGTILGTPFYMAPEQARGMQVDGRIDVYAMGVILYEMLTGMRPIGGSDIHEILTNIFFTPIPPPRKLRQDLPAELEEVVLTAMSRDLDERYESAAAMRDAVLDFIEQPARSPSETIDTLNAPVPQRTSRPPETPAVPRSAFEEGEPKATTTPGPVVTESQEGGRTRSPLSMLIWGLAVAIVVVGSTAVWFALDRDNAQQNSTTTTAPTTVASVAGEVEAPALDVPVTAIDAALESGGDESNPEVSDQPDADSAPAGDAETGEMDALSEEDSPTAENVLITLTGLPDGATITVDGDEVEGPVLTVSRSTETVRLLVRAEGYRSFQHRVSTNEATTIPVRMQRRSQEPPSRDVAQPTKAPASQEPASPVSSFGEMP